MATLNMSRIWPIATRWTMIRFSLFVFAVCIAGAGALVWVGTYLYVAALEKQDAKDAFVSFCNTIQDISKFHLKTCLVHGLLAH
jgi:hypothetical protein